MLVGYELLDSGGAIFFLLTQVFGHFERRLSVIKLSIFIFGQTTVRRACRGVHMHPPL